MAQPIHPIIDRCRRRSQRRLVAVSTSWMVAAMALLLLLDSDGTSVISFVFQSNTATTRQSNTLSTISTVQRHEQYQLTLASRAVHQERRLALFGIGDESPSSSSSSSQQQQHQTSRKEGESPSNQQQQLQQSVFDPERLTLLRRQFLINETEAPSTVIWDVYVDQSKASLDRGGSATLDAFWFLSPPSLIRVIPCLLPKTTKTKGPLVRCVHLPTDQNIYVSTRPSLEVANVDSVDKVFRILTRHMRIPGIDAKTCECLKWKYRGNGHLEAGRVMLAIDTYDKALVAANAIGSTNTRLQQEGTILLLRATAFLQRAKEHKVHLQKIVHDLESIPEQPDAMTPLLDQVVKTTTTPKANTATAAANANGNAAASLGPPLFRRILSDSRHYEKQFRRTQYRHGLYQYALLHAARDSLRATQLLPQSPPAWLRAAETLSDLWKLKESAQYYQRAQELDATLVPTLQVVIDKLERRQTLLDHARAFGWSEDTLRLALDVAG